MACSFNFVLPVDPSGLMQMVKQVVEKEGGVVSGEIPNITISMPTILGQVTGSCRYLGDSAVNITVTQLPSVVSCSMAREQLVYFITEAVKMYVQQSKAAKKEGAVVI